jgi:hypothetical protein
MKTAQATRTRPDEEYNQMINRLTRAEHDELAEQLKQFMRLDHGSMRSDSDYTKGREFVGLWRVAGKNIYVDRKGNLHRGHRIKLLKSFSREEVVAITKGLRALVAEHSR